MPDRRLQLQTMLETVLGSENVYFQPPPNFQMKYPCIVYERDSFNTAFADNMVYKFKKRYSVTVISKHEDDPVNLAMLGFSLCAHNRRFIKDKLYHDVFELYF